MTPSVITKDQAKKIGKAALYVGASAILDYLISETSGTQFGTLTPILNVALVTLRQVFKQG